MREFFIETLEKLVSVLVVLMMVGVVIGTLAMMFNPQGGFLAGLMFLIFGLVYTVIMGGVLYLFLGIYQNTKRTAELLEAKG